MSSPIDFLSLDLEHAKEAWDEWEIHCLILLSLSLQVFLFLTADLRRRRASRMLSTILWLAYVSADTVAIFVLGHLAVHAQGQSHEVMLFWAPFVLVHLGGQDSITAFSKQDNELWTRHLLGLVTQTAVAGYVVSKSSWLDTRLRAAMVLMFLCGFLKYAGRTCCLFLAKSHRASSMALRNTLSNLQDAQVDVSIRTWGKGHAKQRFEAMFLADKCWEFINKNTRVSLLVDDIMLVDAPVDGWEITIVAEELPDMLKENNMPDRCIAYQYVAASLGQSYQCLYTKAILPRIFGYCFRKMDDAIPFPLYLPIAVLLLLSYTLFQCVSTAIALVLFASAQKKGHHSKADITVSYILLVGALLLDLLPTFTSILSSVRKPFRPGTVHECAELSLFSCIQPQCWRTTKQWSEELPQYSMTRRYASVQAYHGCMPMPSIQKWILKHKPFGTWCVEFFDLTRTTVADDLKLFVLDKLLLLQTRPQEWDFAIFRGERALGKWMDSHRVPKPESSGYAVHKSLSSRVEFPTSVLIWHIATEICYFSEDNAYVVDNEPDEMKKRKKMCRELSHYIMYLVFKCDVMLTSNSRLVHEKAHEKLTEYFRHVHLDEKETVIKLFEDMKKEEANKIEEQQQASRQGVAQDSKANEAPANKDAAATSSESGSQDLLQRMMEALYSPVLPLTRDVAQELIKINDEAERWELISEVWLEMLFYTAPRCGAAFHYEHLSTGGEFITHVLFLMRSLGPFMPKPEVPTSPSHYNISIDHI